MIVPGYSMEQFSYLNFIMIVGLLYPIEYNCGV